MLSQYSHLLCLSVTTKYRPLSSSTFKHDRKLILYKENVDFQKGDGTKRRMNFGIRHVCNAIQNDQLKQVYSSDNGLKKVEANATLSGYDKSKENMKKMFEKVELSISSYDTAWVAMVPSPSSPNTPSFPECLNWLLENQHHDGSWGLHHGHPLLVKDALSSTLACVIALRRWGVGEEQINKGLHFIKSNFSFSTDEKQHSPIGFDIIFPGMIEYAKDMNFNLDLESAVLDGILRKRDLEIERLRNCSKGRKKAYLAYVSEGIGKFQDWEMVMKYQKKDGSLFNSPSTTAAALIHLKDPPGCLSYLRSVLKVFGNSVPTIYPLDIYSRLCVIDNFVKLGIDRHFTKDIKMVLDMTYRSWLQKDEEIFSDVTTCAIAFRILLLNRYDVSPDPLIHFFKDGYMDTFSGNMDHMNAALEVYKALELTLNINETAAVEKSYLWCRNILKNKMFLSSHTKKFRLEVNDALQFPYYVDLERLRTRRYIEQQYDTDSIRLQKTSYCSPNISNGDFLKLAVEDFNMCQLLQREELEDLDRWYVENKLDQLCSRTRRMSHFYFTAAATLFPPEFRDSRLAWAKTVVLEVFFDDIFDMGASSQEEILNLVELISKWDVNLHTDCRSDQIRILFSALQNTICDIGDKASRCQAKNVTKHIVEMWFNFINAGCKEAMWRINKVVPTMDEYITNGRISIATGPILIPCSYFLGIKLSEEVFTSTEFHNIFKHTGTCGRLLNDIQTYERESEEGDLNAVSLIMVRSNVVISKEKAIEELKSIVKDRRKEVFRLVYTSQEKDAVVPRACKDLFWTMCRILHHFYWKDDGFGADIFVNFENDMWNEPIVLDQL